MFTALNVSSGLLLASLLFAGWMDAIPWEALGPSAAGVIICFGFLHFLKGQREADRAAHAEQRKTDHAAQVKHDAAQAEQRKVDREERQRHEKWLEAIATNCHGAHATTVAGLKESQERATEATDRMNETGSHLREQIRETSRESERTRGVLHKLSDSVDASTEQSEQDSRAMRDMIARLVQPAQGA